MKNNYKLYHYSLLWLCIFLSGPLFAQEFLKGQVRDANAPLPGVVVQVKNSTNGTITDSNGNYHIKVKPNDKLQFSFMGYHTQEILISNQKVLDLVLKQDNEQLDEITINAGYYTVKDRERTGSITKVTAKDIEFQPVINPLQAIQGRMAGVSITQNTGISGGGFDIQIRGRNSLSPFNTGANKPLYIIDGIPIDETSIINSSGLSSSLFNSSISALNAINPKDIESIEILKDADATAIYGSRGANGVVLITTKKGLAGKTNFTVSSSTSFSKVGKFMEMMNTEQFNQMRDEAFVNDGITTPPTNAYDRNGTWDRNRYTDWQKELIGGTAVGKDISLGISGGNEYTRFNINAAHGENTTVFPTDQGYKRNSALINLSHRSKDNKLQIQTATTYSTQSNNLPYADLTNQSLRLAPTAPALYDVDGNLNWQNDTYGNPLAQLNKTYNNKTRTLILNTNVSYNLFSNVFLKLNTGITTNALEERVLTPHTIYNPSYNLTSELSMSEKAFNNSNSYILEPQLHWNKKWNKHAFQTLIGSTFQSNNTNSFKITGRNFSSNALITNIAAAKTKTIDQIGDSEYKYVALFARLNYTYNDKYILNLTGRRDGSSRFGDNNKFGNFGAVGAAWIFSEEVLLKNKSWLSFGKLRGSYGATGSDNIGDYAYLDTYTLNTNTYENLIGLYPSHLYNPDYSWEKTTKLEGALELGFLNDRINTSIAWYQNRSSNQLIGITLPNTTGFGAISDNFPATVQNSGWEFTLNATPISTKDWRWQTNFNLSFPKNKLVAFPGLEDSTYRNSYVIGQSINLVKLYNYEGIDPNTGLYQFTDYDTDGKLTNDDKQIEKEIGVHYHGGLQNTLSYKNFALDFLFQFVKQTNYNFLNSYRAIGELSSNYPVEMIDRWSSVNKDAAYTYSSNGGNIQLMTLNDYLTTSSRSVSDASFVRLKNASISYTIQLPQAKIKSLRIYMQGQNLWTFTDYFGMDPEAIFMGNLPPLRTYAFGVQLTF